MMTFLRSLPALASSHSTYDSTTSTPAAAHNNTTPSTLPIPEEILEHILGLLFPSSSAVLSTAPSALSLPHSVLLVSRTFNRIGTPLLYRALYLSSPRRANALAATLKRRPDLAGCIKAVRVESPLVGAAFDDVVDVLRRMRCGGARETSSSSSSSSPSKHRYVLNYLDVSLDAPRVMPTARARTTSRVGAPPSLPDATVPSDEDVRRFCHALARVPDVRKLVVRKSGYTTMRPTVDATCALTDGVRRWMSLEYAHLRYKPGPLPITQPTQAPLQTAAPKSPISPTTTTTRTTKSFKYPPPLNHNHSSTSGYSHYAIPPSPTTTRTALPPSSDPLALALALADSPHLQVLRTHTPSVWSDFLSEVSFNPSLERIELVDAGEDAALDRAREVSGLYSGVASPVAGSFAGPGRGRGMSEGPSSMPGTSSLFPLANDFAYGSAAAPGAAQSLFNSQAAKCPRLQALIGAGRKAVLAARFSIEGSQIGGNTQAPGMGNANSAPGRMGGSGRPHALAPAITFSHSRTSTPSSHAQQQQPCPPTPSPSSSLCPNGYEHGYQHQYRTRAYTNPSSSPHMGHAGPGRGHGSGVGVGAGAGLVRVGRS